MKKYLISGFNTVQDVRLEADTYTLVAYAKSMYGNVYTFALGDGENWTEYDIDVIQGQLCKVWLTFTIDKKVTKFKPIANNFSESLPVYVTDLQLTRGNIPVETGASPFDIDKILDDLHDAIDGIEDFTNGVFADGLLNREEKTQLRASLDAIGAIVESVKGSYNKLLDNPFIHEDTMLGITTRYYAFIASWISDGDPRGLKPVILWIVNGDNIISQNERDEKDRALNAFNDALYEYNQAEKEVYSDVGAAIDNAQADANVSLAKTKGFTKIGDVNFPEGLIFTSLIKLLDAGDDGDEMAGVSGIAGGNKEYPAFWAGGSYDQAIGGTAKVIIRHDGSGHFAGGNISWDEEGNSLFTGSIQSSDEGNRIVIDGGDRSLKMINKFDKQLVNFHFYEGTSGWGTSYSVLRMDLWRKDALGEWTYGEYTDYSPFGIEFRSTDNALPWVGQLTSSSMLLSYGNEGTASERSISINLFDDQYLEMRMKGSVISNLSLKPRIVIGTSSVWLDHWDVFVTCYNTANINVYLPSSPSLGAIKFIRRMNASTVTAQGNGKQISHGNGSVSASISVGAGRGDTAVLFWDGQYWTYNYMVRDS